MRRVHLTAGVALLLPLMACEAAPTSLSDEVTSGGFGVVENARFPFEAIGFYLSAHPLDTYSATLAKMRVQNFGDFALAV